MGEEPKATGPVAPSKDGDVARAPQGQPSIASSAPGVGPSRVPSPTAAPGVASGDQTGGLLKGSAKALLGMATFQKLLDRANRDQHYSGRPASFQYTLCAMMALVIIVSIVGGLLLDHAVKEQRKALTSSTAGKRFTVNTCVSK